MARPEDLVPLARRAEELHPALELAIVRAQVVDLRGAAWSSGTVQLVQSLRAAATRRRILIATTPTRAASPSPIPINIRC